MERDQRSLIPPLLTASINQQDSTVQLPHIYKLQTAYVRLDK